MRAMMSLKANIEPNCPDIAKLTIPAYANNDTPMNQMMARMLVTQMLPIPAVARPSSPEIAAPIIGKMPIIIRMSAGNM